MRPTLLIAVAYLLGSIPFGYLIVRARGGGDVRETGSGGTGATNVTRRAGKWAGLLTLALDAAKGAAAVLLARWLITRAAGGDGPGMEGEWLLAACAVAAVAGHVFPVWLKFRGGKGVAPGLGVLVALAPLSVVPALAAFLLVVWRTRYVSLGSITAAAVAPLTLLGAHLLHPHYDEVPRIAAAAAVAALIIHAHRANIARLRRGTESKIK